MIMGSGIFLKILKISFLSNIRSILNEFIEIKYISTYLNLNNIIAKISFNIKPSIKPKYLLLAD